MPIFDYVCKPCNKEKLDEWTRNHQEKVKCDECNKEMEKKISAPNLGGFNHLGQSGNH